MHFMVSWDIRGAGDNWNKYNDQLKNQLGTYLEIKPLTTVHIVKVTSETGRTSVMNKLTAVAKQIEKSGKIQVWILASPPMTIGSYHGWLPQDWWDAIAKFVS